MNLCVFLLLLVFNISYIQYVSCQSSAQMGRVLQSLDAIDEILAKIKAYRYKQANPGGSCQNNTVPMKALGGGQPAAAAVTTPMAPATPAYVTNVPVSSRKSCKDLNCTKDVKRKIHSNGYLLLSKKAGMSYPCINKQFLLSALMNNASNAVDDCCGYGMELATFESRAEFQCLYNQTGLTKESIFWVSYHDFSQSRNFVSCKKDQRADGLWAVSEPDNAKGLEACVGVDLNLARPGGPGLVDLNCTEIRNYVCEYTMVPPAAR